MSTVKELFLSTDRDAVLAALYRHYDDQEKSHEGYCKAWDTIVAMEPTLSELAWLDVDLIEENFPEDDGTINKYPDVCGVKMGDETRYAVSLMEWPEWLNLEVRIKAPSFTKVDAVAHILYELTFHGFDPETVEEFSDDLKAQAKEIDEFHESLEGMTEEERKAAYKKAGYRTWEPNMSIEEFLNMDDDDD